MKNTLAPIVLACTLSLGAHAEAGDEDARAEATAILSQIADTCVTKGIPACEPNLRGIEPLFDYLRAVGAMEETEKRFVAFVRERYSLPDFTMDQMAAHLKVNLNITMTAHSFEGQIQKATRVPGGYDVQTKDGLGKLRREKEIWVAYMPTAMESNMGTIRRYTSAAKLKHAIMTYRMLEAEMLDYDLDAFATRFVADLGPLTVATLRREDLVAQMPDWQQRLDGVIKFYSRFDSVEGMRGDILATKDSRK
jgi:hypothetical protein